MTLRTYAQLLRRRWYVLLVLLVCTAAVGVLMPRDTGVYWSRTTLVFVPPVNPARLGNVLEGSDPSLVYFAAAVEQVINDGDRGPQLASPSATLYGAGVRRGHSVTLINSGGQWQTNFNRPMLTIEVVDSSAERAQTVMDQTVLQVQSTALEMQRNAGARTSVLIRTELSPQVPVITYVPGNPTRGLAAVALLGGGLSLAGTLWADRWLNRRRRRTPSTLRTGVVATS